MGLFDQVRRGQAWKPKAADINAFADAALADRMGDHDQGVDVAAYDRPLVWAWVKGTQPTASLSNATNATPIVITSTAHGLLPGDSVTITAVGGNTAANGGWSVTIIDADTFSLQGSVGNSAYTSGGSWSRILPMYSPVTLGNPIISPEQNLIEWQREPTFQVTASGDFFGAVRVGILLEPLSRNSIVKCCIIGVVPALCLLNKNADIYADIFSTGTVLSSAGSGSNTNGGAFHLLSFDTVSSGSITAATNASPIVITTSGAHGLSSGMTVIVRNVLGNTAANGQWTISVQSSTTFALNGSTGNGAYTSGGSWAYPINGTITNATQASPIVITSTAHGLISGQAVSISGIVGNTAANGPWVVTVINANSFSLNSSTGNAPYSSGGQWTGPFWTVVRVGCTPSGGAAVQTYDPLTHGISGATNATPIVITTTSTAGLVTGNTVQIAGVGGNTGANGQWQITVINATTFSLSGSVGNGAYTSGGTWSTDLTYNDVVGTILIDQGSGLQWSDTPTPHILSLQACSAIHPGGISLGSPSQQLGTGGKKIVGLAGGSSTPQLDIQAVAANEKAAIYLEYLNSGGNPGNLLFQVGQYAPASALDFASGAQSGLVCSVVLPNNVTAAAWGLVDDSVTAGIWFAIVATGYMCNGIPGISGFLLDGSTVTGGIITHAPTVSGFSGSVP